jgi:hypothetical protein
MKRQGTNRKRYSDVGRAEINMDIGHEFSIFTLQIKSWA